MLQTILKKSKQKYFNKYLENNWDDMKNTLRRIKNMITLNTVWSSSPRAASVNDVATTNSCDTASALNNYFISNAKKIKGKY